LSAILAAVFNWHLSLFEYLASQNTQRACVTNQAINYAQNRAIMRASAPLQSKIRISVRSDFNHCHLARFFQVRERLSAFRRR